MYHSHIMLTAGFLDMTQEEIGIVHVRQFSFLFNIASGWIKERVTIVRDTDAF